MSVSARVHYEFGNDCVCSEWSEHICDNKCERAELRLNAWR